MALSLLGSATRSVPPVAERNFEQRVSPSPRGKKGARLAAPRVGRVRMGDRTDRACNPRKSHLGAIQASPSAREFTRRERGERAS